VVEAVAIEGPLEADRLGWVAGLYGPVDPRYHDREFLAHLFARGPGGPALHAFATDAGVPVGHAAVVPTPARRGSAALRAGKLEALVVAASHRGSREGGPPVVRLLLDTLYELADARGFEALHAYVLPRVGRVIRFTRVDDVAPPSLVALLRTSRSGPAAVAERALTAAQLGARVIARVGLRTFRTRTSAATVRALAADDAELLETPPLRDDAWALVGAEAWGWYASSPYVRILEPGDGSRALVQLPGWPREPLRIAAWYAPAPGIKSALVLLDAAARLARESGAATLRIQTPRPEPSLRRAARALGFVERSDLATLWVRSADPALTRPGAIVPTASLYLGF
jgi:hypothetical protein